MRQMFLAALGIVVVAGVASAQQPQYPVIPVPPPTYGPAVVAASPIIPASGVSILRGNGCSNCGSKGQSVTGGNCHLAQPCQNGCGSVKSDLAFQFGSCKNFFNPCGPTCGSMLRNREKCPTTQFNQPFGIGWQCPRQYDSYANH